MALEAKDKAQTLSEPSHCIILPQIGKRTRKESQTHFHNK